MGKLRLGGFGDREGFWGPLLSNGEGWPSTRSPPHHPQLQALPVGPSHGPLQVKQAPAVGAQPGRAGGTGLCRQQLCGQRGQCHGDTGDQGHPSVPSAHRSACWPLPNGRCPTWEGVTQSAPRGYVQPSPCWHGVGIAAAPGGAHLLLEQALSPRRKGSCHQPTNTTPVSSGDHRACVRAGLVPEPRAIPTDPPGLCPAS